MLQRADAVAVGFEHDGLGPLLSEQSESELACLPYQQLDGTEGLWVPWALSRPSYLDDPAAPASSECSGPIWVVVLVSLPFDQGEPQPCDVRLQAT